MINQLHLKPVIIDLLGIRAPRESSTDIPIALRNIESQLKNANGKFTIRYRHRGKRRTSKIKLKSISVRREPGSLSGAVIVSKIKSEHMLFWIESEKTRNRGILYVLLHPESLYLKPDELIIKTGETPVVLSNVIRGYDAIALILEGEMERMPSEFIKNIDIDVYVLPQDYKTIAYRAFRYSS